MCENVQLEVLGDDYHATHLMSFHLYFKLDLELVVNELPANLH